MEKKLYLKKNLYTDLRGFGIGIVSYFKLIYWLIITFCVLTIVMLPTIGIYSSKIGFRGKITDNLFYTVPSLGNIGKVVPLCKYHFVYY